MKLVIRSSCKGILHGKKENYKVTPCDFSGTVEEVYEHCKKTGHGGYSETEEGFQKRCWMNPNPDDLVRAILKASVQDIADRVCKHDEIYVNFLDQMVDDGACDKLPWQLEGDDVDDVLRSYKIGKLKEKVVKYLKNIDTIFEKTEKKNG